MKATEATTELQQPMDEILTRDQSDESYCAVSHVLLLIILQKVSIKLL